MFLLPQRAQSWTMWWNMCSVSLQSQTADSMMPIRFGCARRLQWPVPPPDDSGLLLCHMPNIEGSFLGLVDSVLVYCETVLDNKVDLLFLPQCGSLYSCTGSSSSEMPFGYCWDFKYTTTKNSYLEIGEEKKERKVQERKTTRKRSDQAREGIASFSSPPPPPINLTPLIKKTKKQSKTKKERKLEEAKRET